MKNYKLKGYLFGWFITSILCMSTAQAKSYQWLKCNPIPDKITIRFPDGHTTYTKETPSLGDLDSIAANNETVLIPSPDYATKLPPSLRRTGLLQIESTSSTVITKPSIYISCELPGVLLKDCYNTQLRPELGYLGHPQEWNIRTNIRNIYPFDKYNLSGSKEDSIEGHKTHSPSATVTVHEPWQLKRSVNHPDYWLFQGEVTINNPGMIENILGDVGDLKFYSINQHYYTCTLETEDESYYDTILKLKKENRKYIKVL